MKRALAVLLGVVVVLAVVAGVVFFGLGFYLSPQSPLAKSDAIVAVSGGDTTARADEAIKLYQAKWAAKLIFSGAALDPNSPSNAQIMARLATEQGVPASAIEIDEGATNTEENAAGVAKIAARDNLHSVILVTSPYHQRRAYTVFRKALGKSLVIRNHSSIDKQWRRSHWWATDYSRSLTYSETQKTIYELFNGNH